MDSLADANVGARTPLRQIEIAAVHFPWSRLRTREGIREAKVSGELAKWHLKFNGQGEAGQGEAPAIETAETMDSEAAADFEDA